MTDPENLDAELRRAFGIEAADIACNRLGKLGARQIARLRRNAIAFVALGFVFAAALCVPLIERLIDGRQPPLVPSLVVAAAGLGILGAFLRFARQTADTAKHATVTCVTGPAHLVQSGRVVRATVGPRAALQLPAGWTTRWRKLFHGRTFRAYVRDPGDWIVAMEWADDALVENAAPDPILAALAQVAAPTWAALWVAGDTFAAETIHTTWSTVPGEVPYPSYAPATAALWSQLQTLIAVAPFAWKQWGGLDRYKAGTGLPTAPVAEAMRLVTALTRAERFGEGAIGNAADNGTFAAIVVRLRKWHDEQAANPS